MKVTYESGKTAHCHKIVYKPEMGFWALENENGEVIGYTGSGTIAEVTEEN